MKEIKFRYTGRNLSGQFFSMIFTLQEIEEREVFSWMKLNNIVPSSIIRDEEQIKANLKQHPLKAFENLKCCGNCAYNGTVNQEGILREENCRLGKDAESSGQVCDQWKPDGLMAENRRIGE